MSVLGSYVQVRRDIWGPLSVRSCRPSDGGSGHFGYIHERSRTLDGLVVCDDSH